MLRKKTGLLLTLALAGCSAKSPAPAPGDSPRASSAMGIPAAAAAGAVATPVPAPDPRESALAAIVLRLLEQEHLLRKKIDDAVSRVAFTTYLDRLDGGKMFLLAADREALAKHTDKIDDQLRSGSLDLAHDGAKVFAKRVAVVEKLVAELTATPLDFTNEEHAELDPKKLQLATSEQELRDRWRRRLELEVLERVAAMEERLNPPAAKPTGNGKANDTGKANGSGKTTGSGSGTGMPPGTTVIDEDDDEADKSLPLSKIPTTPAGREEKARTDLAKTYAGRFARLRTPGPLDAASELVNAVSAVLDPHSTYLPPADKANFDIAMSGSLE
ncbi:MAG: hypothetical protein H0X17_00985, partial [Deltaproteobacteria bacterium]|nr:hypothetical protein [Deltaproteobacteria bacterium]